MGSAAVHVDRADVRQTDDEHTLILTAASVHVMLIRLRYEDWIDEVVNSAGTIAASAINAWALNGRNLFLELSQPAAALLGVPRDLRLLLDIGDDALWRARTALLEILQSACFTVDTAEGRTAS